jgi:hypothetical protein
MDIRTQYFNGRLNQDKDWLSYPLQQSNLNPDLIPYNSEFILPPRFTLFESFESIGGIVKAWSYTRC